MEYAPARPLWTLPYYSSIADLSFRLRGHSLPLVISFSETAVANAVVDSISLFCVIWSSDKRRMGYFRNTVEAQATRYGSSGRCSFFSWSLVLASAVLSLVSTVLGVVTWKLLGEDIGFDVGQNASAMMRLLFHPNVSSNTAPRSASSDAAAGTPSDGAESVLP